MNYEKLKDTVARAVGDRLHRETSYIAKAASLAVSMDMIAERRSHADSREALVAAVEKRIRGWDVRAVGNLRLLFPEEFPRGLRKGQLVADFTDAGWEVLTTAGVCESISA